MAGYKNKNKRRCNRQGVWQVAAIIQKELSEVTFVDCACQLRRLLIHGRHLSLSRTGRNIHPHRRADTSSSPSANPLPFYGTALDLGKNAKIKDLGTYGLMEAINFG